MQWVRRPNGNLNLMSGRVRIALVRKNNRRFEWAMEMPRPNVQHFSDKGVCHSMETARANAEHSFKLWLEYAEAGVPEIAPAIVNSPK